MPSAALAAAAVSAARVASAPAAAASAALALTGTDPMLVSPIRASATRPWARLASAATPTMPHACAVDADFA